MFLIDFSPLRDPFCPSGHQLEQHKYNFQIIIIVLFRIFLKIVLVPNFFQYASPENVLYAIERLVGIVLELLPEKK